MSQPRSDRLATGRRRAARTAKALAAIGLALTLAGCGRLGHLAADPSADAASTSTPTASQVPAGPGMTQTPAPEATSVQPTEPATSPGPSASTGSAIDTGAAEALLRAVDGALGQLDGAVVDADSATAQGE
jgi:predicted small lipoprotein YifL